MEEVKGKCLPGTALPYTDQGMEAFANIEALIAVTGGLSLSQVCAITGLEGSTIQNWVKRGWVSNPKGKKYSQEQLARIIIINALKECIKLESIALLMKYISVQDGEGDAVSERELFDYLCKALRIIERSDDVSGGGITAVVDELTGQYEERTRARLRRALSVMIYACVCSDVKRRTEVMLAEIIPGSFDEVPEPEAVTEAEPADTAEAAEENSEAVEDEADTSEDGGDEAVEPEPVAAPSRSWFSRRR